MTYNFGLDLRVARRKAALTQQDCAHLLGVTYTRISKLESGQVLPTVTELSILCVVFDTEVTRLNLGIVAAEAKALDQRLASMPDCPKNWPSRRNRLNTLNALAEKLTALTPPYD
ncbi:helix-turn-helix transcriptional regulator [Mesorhizobium sp. 10J20-29]